MREELEQRIVERWPTWFRMDGDVRETLMLFGFEHGDGWFDLVCGLCEQIEPVVATGERESGRPFEVLQVKEKFGGLRFYTNFIDETISALNQQLDLRHRQIRRYFLIHLGLDHVVHRRENPLLLWACA